MIFADLSGIKLQAITCAVPSKCDDLTEYRAKFGNEAVDKFTAMTGVRSRRIAKEEQTSSDLAYAAAKLLIEKENIDIASLGACVFVTQTPDYRIPATACVLAKRLELPMDCVAFDVNLGCSGYVYGLNIVASLMKTSNISSALLLVGDTLNKSIDAADKSACMLFGDAGAATLLVKEENACIKAAYRTDGNGFKAIIMPAGAYRNRDAAHESVLWADGNYRSDFDLYMNGTDVFSFTITEVPKLVREYMLFGGGSVDDFDSFVMHQANSYILKQVAKKIKITADKLPISMDRYGNTSVTSIPLTLCDAYAGKDEIIRTLMCGFGIGLSWGVADAQIDASHLYPIFETDEYYMEGAVSHD